MAKRKNYRPLMALVALAAAALVAAAVTFTNVTYWLINATLPPAMKYPGDDTAVAGGQYVKVSYYYDSARGINITRISIIGFTGDPTNYTSVIKVCNKYGTTPITATLAWVGPVGSTGYENYIRAFLVKGPDGRGVGFVGTTTYNTAGPYTINPGRCIDIGAYVVIDPTIPPHLANGRTVLGQYQVDIRMMLGGGGGGGGGGGTCSFVASSGRRFGSPDGTPARGFNELNGWVAAWGSSGGGVRVALMPGITPPDSTGTGASYTVELVNVQIGTLTISGGNASVSITEPMPAFMQVVRIWLEPGGHVLYDNGTRPAVDLTPGTYQVRATLRAAPRSDIYGSAADLTLRCGGSPAATITLRVPDPREWGLRADIYRVTPGGPLPWPPFEGAAYTYRGTWSVGAINFWADLASNPVALRAPYFSWVQTNGIPPKWVAYWYDPTATSWSWWGVRYTGRLYVPWSDIRVGLWADDAVYVRLCSINPSNWLPGPSWFRRVSGTCGAPGVYDVEVGYVQTIGGTLLIFIIGPGAGNDAYIPTIDGAWHCSNFNWSTGRCNVAWSFVPASAGVPHFVGTNYMPSLTVDGGGTPLP